MSDLLSIPWSELAPFMLIGFFAQLVDGTLGMAFGVLSHSLLVALGLPPTTAAATARTVESFASGVSGICHGLQRNIDWALFARIVIPGCVGGFVGAWVLSSLSLEIARPIVLTYLAAVGAYLIWRGPRRPHTYRRMRMVGALGFAGGFLDASGSGGWGPMVTGNLLAQGGTPRTVIGTVSAAEFFVTVTVLAAYVGTLGLPAITIAVSGLIIGTALAAPIGPYLVNRIAPRPLILFVGITLIAVSLYGFLSLVFVLLPSFPRF